MLKIKYSVDYKEDMNLFAEAALGVARTKIETEYSDIENDSMLYHVGIGIDYFIIENIAFETILEYDYINNGGYSTYSGRSDFTSFGIGLGLVVLLH